ncbi:hypothetical protein ABK040_015900 [Willaertia magna]
MSCGKRNNYLNTGDRDDENNLKKRKNDDEEIKGFIPNLLIIDLIMCYLNDDLQSQIKLKHLNKHFNEICELLNKPFLFKLWLQFKHEIYPTLQTLSKEINSDYAEFLNGCVLSCFAKIRMEQVLGVKFISLQQNLQQNENVNNNEKKSDILIINKEKYKLPENDEEEDDDNYDDDDGENKMLLNNFTFTTSLQQNTQNNYLKKSVNNATIEESFVNNEQNINTLTELQNIIFYQYLIKNKLIELIYLETFICHSAQQVRSGIKFKTIDNKEIILHTYYYWIVHGRGYNPELIYKVNIEYLNDNYSNNNYKNFNNNDINNNQQEEEQEEEDNEEGKEGKEEEEEEELIKIYEFEDTSFYFFNNDKIENLFKKLQIYKDLSFRDMLFLIQIFSGFYNFKLIKSIDLKYSLINNEEYFDNYYVKRNDVITKIKRNGIDVMNQFLNKYLYNNIYNNSDTNNNDLSIITKQSLFQFIEKRRRKKEIEKQENLQKEILLFETEIQKKFIKTIKLESYTKDFDYDEYTNQQGCRLKCEFLLNNDKNIFITINASKFPNYADSTFFYIYFYIQLNDKLKCFYCNDYNKSPLIIMPEKEEIKVEEIIKLFNLDNLKSGEFNVEEIFLKALSNVMIKESKLLLDISFTYHYKNNNLDNSVISDILKECQFR